MNHHWLEQEIATQLDLAGAWLTRTDGTTDEEWAKLRLYETTGSCLRIFVRVPEERRDTRLRIAKVSPLLLTDGAVLIQSSLTPECHRHLRTRPPDSSFVVRTYTLRYTPYGPLRDQIHFSLNGIDFDCRSDASKEAFGSPTPVHLCEEVVESAQKLRQIHFETDRKCFGVVEHAAEDADTMSSIEHQGGAANNEDVSPDTPMAYGTQIVPWARTLSDITEKETEMPRNKSSDDFAKAQEVLRLLGKRNVAPRDSPPTRELSDASPKNAPVPPSAGGFTRTSTSRASNERVAPPTGRMQSTRLPPPYPQDKATHKPPVSVTTNDSGSLVIRQGGLSSHAVKDAKLGASSRSQSNENVMEDPEPDWLRGSCLADGCGRVPEAQQKLLSYWQKRRAGASDNFPANNIPIDVLKALRRFKINASSYSDSQREEGSSALKAHSADEENTAEFDEEESTASEVDSPAIENAAISDREDDSPICSSWASSPAAKGALFRPDPALPPDSSLPDKSTGSRDEPQEESPVQEAQRVEVNQPSNEENTFGPHSSPPLILGGDDSDMDMELDLPRGLEGHSSVRNIPLRATDILQAAVVQVKETPYRKEKNPALPSSAIVTAQAQQQTSSGSSKDTSSTSIIYGTYHELSSSIKSLHHHGQAEPSNSAVLVSSYDSQKDMPESEYDVPLHSADDAPTVNVEPVDVHMKDGTDQPPQPSPHLPKPSSRLQPEQPDTEDRMSPFVSPVPSPVSGQKSHSVDKLLVNTSLAKRKFDQSPPKQGRRPSKRGKFPRYMGFGDGPAKDFAEDIRRQREQHYEDFIQRERTASLAGEISSSDERPGAQATSSPNPQESGRRSDERLTGVQTHSIIDTDPSEVGGPATQYQATAGGNEELHSPLLFESGTDKFDQRLSLSPPPTLELPEDVDIEIDNADNEDSNNEMALDVDVDNTVPDHAGSGYVGSCSSQAQTSRVSDTPARAALFATTTKERETSLPFISSATIFETFTSTYPAYTGDSRHFLGQCKQIEKLDKQDKMVPKWQWDDFIIRNRTDYREYANHCLDNGEDAEPYYRFYKDNIRNTLYAEGIIGSRQTLAAAIGELEGEIAAKAPASATENVVETPRASFTTAGPHVKTRVTKGSAIMAPTAKVLTSKVPTRGQAAVERTAPGTPVLSKPRQSLPSAFSRRSGTSTSATPRPSNERSRQSFPASSSRVLSSLPSSNFLQSSTPAKHRSGSSTYNSMSTHRPLQRTSSGSRMPREPTGDPYRDFVFARNRATSFTGSTSIDPDPQKKWPENLHVRPVAEVKRKGYDVLDWKDDL